MSQQMKFMKYLFRDQHLAYVWHYLLVNRDYVTQKGEKLRYEVGQPMGAYSSWASLALFHHLVVQ